MVQLPWKTAGLFPKNVNIKLSYDPMFPFLGITPEEPKTNNYTQIFSIIHKGRKEETTCTPISWQRDVQNVVLKGNELLIQATPGISLTNILFGKKARHKRSYVVWFRFNEVSRIRDRDRKLISGCWGRRGGWNGEWLLTGIGFSFEVMEMFWT